MQKVLEDVARTQPGSRQQEGEPNNVDISTVQSRFGVRMITDLATLNKPA